MIQNILPSDPDPHGHAVAKEELKSEIQDYLYTSDQRRRLFPRALLVGIAAGTVAVIFRAALAGGDALRASMLTYAHRFPLFGWIVPVTFGAVLAGLSVALVRKFAPEAAGSGIPHLEAVLKRFRVLDGKKVLPIKFFGGLLAMTSGLVVGREGPTVQMGASMADILSHWMKVSGRERRTLLAAGAGAGLAAAFNAPLAGLVFVLEEVQRDFRPIVFGAAFLAAAAADMLARFANGQLPVFHVPSYAVPSLGALPAFALLGVIAGGLGVVFNRCLLAGLNLFARVPKGSGWVAAAIVGGICGLAGWFTPLAQGSGHNLAEIVMAGGITLATVPLWFLVRFLLSMISYSCGAPGGIFAPLLALGALVGLGVGDIAYSLAPHSIPNPGIFAVVGMAAYFSAVVRAPLTGIVLIIEMTGNYAQMLPLIVACFCAYAVAEGLGDHPIYEALLERDLAKGGMDGDHVAGKSVVVELNVQPGAHFDGKLVRDLGLPPGCILVSGRDEFGEWIPGGGTRLKGDDHLTAVISPDVAPEAMQLLREGTEHSATSVL